MKRHLLSAFAMAGLFALTGCGFKGNLYLPPPTTSAKPATPVAAPQSPSASAVKAAP